MRVQWLKWVLAAGLILNTVLCFLSQECVVLCSLPLTDFIRTVIVNESFHCLEPATDSNDHLIVLSFDEYPLLSIGINTF